MSYRPAIYSNPVFEEMERVFGLAPSLHKHRQPAPRQVRPRRTAQPIA